jgi:AraC family transcriptional regulator of adaptative response/methylated-DNA-[protein]-cysteine methyltransferase
MNNEVNALQYKICESPMGYILIAGSDVALHFASIRDDIASLLNDFLAHFPDAVRGDNHPLLKLAEAQLNEYVLGKRREFDLPLHLDGSEFQRSVWKEISKIPYGETSTYSDLAKTIGKPKSYRAVANACGDNPIGLIIPCHRILRSNGELGGYSGGGIAKKRLLLDMENARASVVKNAA